MIPDPLICWGCRCLIFGTSLNGELDAVSGPYRRLLGHLADLPVGERQGAFNAFLKRETPEEEAAIIKAVADQDPMGRPPAPVAGGASRSYATLADVARIVSAQPWLWKGWIALGVLNAVAADPGVGKTRFVLDLARRLWLGQPWPDNQPNELPPGTRTLWIQGDRSFAEMLQAARDFGLPDDAVALGSSPNEPFGSLDLDDPATLTALGERIKAANTPLAIIDTVGMTTARNLSRPDEAREFFAPIMELCNQTGVAMFGLTHLSANKEALGRRIVEKARVVIKMTQPDPDGQPNRRRLWVDKTAVQKPPPLGISMGSAGNDYDFGPPKEPDPAPRKPGPPPAKLEEYKAWLTKQLTPIPARVTDIRRGAEQVSFSVDTLYRSKDALGVEEYTLDRRKWRKLPVVEVVGDKQSGISDNSDKPF